jgi:hypothetical protein
VFPNSDAKSFTFVTVDGSDGTGPDSATSAVSTNGFGNIRDSTALIGSATNNGTRGFTTGPDLVGIAVNNANATIDYTFDQRVGSVNAVAIAFSYNLADGTQIDSLPGGGNRSVSSDGLTVRVHFPAGPTIQGAVRAFAMALAVTSKVGGASSTTCARPRARAAADSRTVRTSSR